MIICGASAASTTMIAATVGRRIELIILNSAKFRRVTLARWLVISTISFLGLIELLALFYFIAHSSSILLMGVRRALVLVEVAPLHTMLMVLQTEIITGLFLTMAVIQVVSLRILLLYCNKVSS